MKTESENGNENPSVKPSLDPKAYYAQLRETDIYSVTNDLGITITREQGNLLFCDCPQHSSSSHESLHVNRDTQQWYCFACGIGGDGLQLIEFTLFGTVSKHAKGDPMSETHRKARDWLAAKKGMPPLNEASMGKEQLTEWRKKLHEADRVFGCLTCYIEFCHQQLFYEPDQVILKEFQAKYPLSLGTIKQQKIGYSVIAGAVEYLEAHGYTHEEMIACGAFKSNSHDYPIPRFKFRYIFPYWKNGRVEYMIGRETKNTPKYERGDSQKRGSKYYKLPTQNDDPNGSRRNISPLISNNILWNEQILDTKPEYVIISEGITDALSAHDRGLPVISPITTYIPNDDQERIIEKIKKLKIQPYICLDNEVSKIGYEAALKMADMFEFNGIKAPKIIILPLTDEQIAAKEEIKTRFGIDDTLTKKQISEKEKHLNQEDRKEYERLCSIAKQDINSYFLAFPEAEGFQKLIDTAQTQHRIKLETYRQRIEEKDIDLLDDDGFLTEMKRAEKFDVKNHTIFMELVTKAKLKTPLKKALKDHEVPAAHFKEEKSQTLNEALTAAGVSVPEGCLALKLPTNYQMSNRGIEFVKKGQAFFKVELVSKYPLLVKRRIRDIATGMISLEILTYDTHGWRSIIAPRSMAFDKGKITKLADVGLWTSPDSLGFLVKYLHDFEAANDEVLSVDAVSSQLGWIEPGLKTFLYGNECIGEDNITFVAPDAGNVQMAEGLSQAGKPEKWLEIAKKAMEYPYVAIMTYAALTAPLLRILDQTTFFVDLSAPTSSGKSIALRFAMSPFGDPKKIVGSCNATQVGLEKAVSTQKDFPFAMDETKNTKGNPVEYSRIVYLLTQGQGRIRGSRQGNATVLHWITVILSTGEASFTDYVKEGGARSRILGLKGYPFHKVDQNTRKFVSELDSAISENFGHVGRTWIEFIMANRDKWKAWKEQFHSDSLQLNTGDSGPAGRFANYRAVITFTARLIHEAGILPWTFVDPFEAIVGADELSVWSNMSGDIREAEIGPRALRDLYSWICANAEKFYGHHYTTSNYRGDMVLTEKIPVTGWGGRWDDKPDWNFVGIFRHVLDESLTSLGYLDLEAVLTDWKAKGWLDTTGKRFSKGVRLGKDKPPMICLLRSGFSAALGYDPGGEQTENRPADDGKIIDFNKFLKRLDKAYGDIKVAPDHEIDTPLI